MNHAARSNLQSKEMSMTVTVFSLFLRVVAAITLLQTLFFKFTAAPESVYIFTKVGAEPWGRIGSGVVELIAVILLFSLRFTWMGSLLASGTMAGAMLIHLTILALKFGVTKACCSAWLSSYSLLREST
jgi:hypothetical protein